MTCIVFPVTEGFFKGEQFIRVKTITKTINYGNGDTHTVTFVQTPNTMRELENNYRNDMKLFVSDVTTKNIVRFTSTSAVHPIYKTLIPCSYNHHLTEQRNRDCLRSLGWSSSLYIDLQSELFNIVCSHGINRAPFPTRTQTLFNYFIPEVKMHNIYSNPFFRLDLYQALFENMYFQRDYFIQCLKTFDVEQNIFTYKRGRYVPSHEGRIQ